LLGIVWFSADVVDVLIPLGVIMGVILEGGRKMMELKRAIRFDVGMGVVKEPRDDVFSYCGV
jgi:hypothetical protein